MTSDKDTGQPKGGKSSTLINKDEYIEAPSMLKTVWYTLIIPLLLLLIYGHGYAWYHGLGMTLRVPQQQPVDTAATYENASGNSQSGDVMQEPVQSVGSTDDNSGLPRMPLPRSDIPRAPEPKRAELDQQIDALREAGMLNPEDPNIFFQLGNALRMRDFQFSDGGTDVQECIAAYARAAKILELNLPYIAADDIPLFHSYMCSIYNYMGFTDFKANRFHSAIKMHTKALNFDCPVEEKASAVKHRADVLFTVNKYDEAARDYLWTLENDKINYTGEAFMGLSRLASSNNLEYIPGGWEWLLEQANSFKQTVQKRLSASNSEPHEVEKHRRHMQAVNYVEYSYNHAIKNYDAAFEALLESHRWKLMGVNIAQAQNLGRHKQQMEELMKAFFDSDIFTMGVGDPSRLPIFIIGYPRTGSTLLERVLDAHPQVGAIGEDSAVPSRLNFILPIFHNNGDIKGEIHKLTNGIARTMYERYSLSQLDFQGKSDKPIRIVDKMLGNYNHVGLIHLMFPNALILHVIRDPMDSCFSSFKHDFGGDGLSHTFSLEYLAEAYTHYREMIEMWDNLLPGVIHHVRYDDMVHDMPNVAKAIIRTAQLEWTDDILDFHKQKHAVNTFSSEQVKEGVYKTSLKSWMKYEKQLQPLKDMLGKYAENHQPTTLDGYT